MLRKLKLAVQSIRLRLTGKTHLAYSLNCVRVVPKWARVKGTPGGFCPCRTCIFLRLHPEYSWDAIDCLLNGRKVWWKQ